MKMNRGGAKAERTDVWVCTQQIMWKWYHSNSVIETIHKVLPSQVECWPLYNIPFHTLHDLLEHVHLNLEE
jgi:hypothetical protein